MTDLAPARGATPAPDWPALGAVHRRTLRALLTGGPRSRAEVARDLSLSRASLTRAARDLVGWGLVAEGQPELRGATGRPGEMLHVRQDAWSVLGVKLTGERLYAVVTDLGARVLAEAEEPLRSREVEDVVAQIAQVRSRLVPGRPPLAATGIGLGGDVKTGLGSTALVDSPYHGWRDVPLGRMLEEALGMPVHVENDVRCLTAAEHLFGVGAGLDPLVVLTVGVGVGFGMLVDGRLVTGAHGTAGRLDHLPIREGGPVCAYCRRPCVSTALTDDGLLRALDRPGTDYAGLLALARAGDADALAVFHRAGRALGMLVAILANTLDPQKVVITGEGIAITEFAREQMDAAIREHAHPDGGPIEVEIAPFAFDEWARAAAVLAIRAMVD